MQCCMVSVDDNEQEVNEVTLRSGRHLSLPQKEKLNQNATHDSSKEKINNSSQPLGEIKKAMKEDTSASASKEEKKGEESSIETPIQYKSYLKSLKNSRNPHRVKYDILAHLRRIPALLSVYDALQLSVELKRALILALLSPNVFKTEIDHIEG